jgi:hypothetical protein
MTLKFVLSNETMAAVSLAAILGKVAALNIVQEMTLARIHKEGGIKK